MMIKLYIQSLAVCFMLLSVHCEAGTGACLGAGGDIVDTCKDDWTEEECQDWNSQNVNGSSWVYHDGDSCADIGYPAACTDGTKVQTQSDCAED